MPLSKEHKAETRQKILDAAGAQFRRHGYNGVGIDDLMAEAGLTRGGFYAHFPSKQALFAAVLTRNHDLVRRLRSREQGTAADLRRGGAKILGDYLDPANFPKIGPNCTLSSLPCDAARADRDAREGYTDALRRLHDEILRGREDGSGAADGFEAQALRIMALAVGALALARSSNDKGLSDAILRAAQTQVRDWMAD